MARDVRVFTWVATVGVALATLLVLLGGPDVRAVFAPAVAVIAVTMLYLVVLTRRQGYLPVFEAATFFVLATAIYTVVPLVQFAMSGMRAVNQGDYRLFSWAPTPEQFGGFAWRHVLLLTTFVLVYLVVRGKRLWRERTFAPPPPMTMWVIITLVVLLRAYFVALGVYVGPVVSVYEGGTGSELLQLPHVVLQITNVLQMMLLTLKQCLVIVLLMHWRRRLWRIILVLWVGMELALTVVAMESRTGAVVLVLTVLVGYHHVVKPIRIRTAFLTGISLLVGFLLFGLVRDIGLTGLRYYDPSETWGAPTEFQILYGNAYDIYRRKLERSLPPMPEYLQYSDLYRLVPSQVLPFYKAEPAEWYKNEVMNLRDSGMGFLLGIVAQSVLGWDWLELFLRALVLAIFYAVAHRAWRRYSGSFWATIAYLFILTWAYYAFRLSSFEILYRLVYYLAPTVIAVKAITMLAHFPGRLRRRIRVAQ